MKQLLQSYKTGELKLEDVPAPALKSGGIIVKNQYSLVGAGTERAVIESAKQDLSQYPIYEEWLPQGNLLRGRQSNIVDSGVRAFRSRLAQGGPMESENTS